MRRMEERNDDGEGKRTAIWILASSQLPKDEIEPVKARILSRAAYDCRETHGVPGQKSRGNDMLGPTTGIQDSSRNNTERGGATAKSSFQGEDTASEI